jgi:hypothetical protein
VPLAEKFLVVKLVSHLSDCAKDLKAFALVPLEADFAKDLWILFH